MTTSDTAALVPYLDVFPDWLRTLGEDARALGDLVTTESNDEVKRHVVSGLNYIFKSLDLIADGIDELGFCDDAFVIRVGARLACQADAEARRGVLGRLAEEAQQVEGFLGSDYPRLVAYVEDLRKGAARGRTVEDIMTDADVRSQFVHEVAAWASEYQPPPFARDTKTLLKLKAFLSAKLA